MPFREQFDCLWCGRAHRTRTPSDLEGWAQLCPDCVSKAGENAFLRVRLKAGLAERSRGVASPVAKRTATPPADRDGGGDAEMLAYYEARAAEYDDWYLRRGRYSHGAIQDAAWQADLDAATLWLDSLPIAGRILELAAGTGWWSPLLAQKGRLRLTDALPTPLERARQRLAAHRLSAEVEQRDAWADPDEQVDALFCGFWISHVPRDRLGPFFGLAHRWLRPGGLFGFIDSATADPVAGAVDRPAPPADDLARRRLSNGREYTIPKVFYAPAELESALLAAGFLDAEVTTTSRFFLLGRATA